MLNEKRIKLMTKMASFEEHEGKKMIPIGNYFKHDYVSYQVLKAIISASIAFGLILVVYIYYDLESFLQNIYKMDMISLAKSILAGYLVLIGAYAIIAYIYYTYRYKQAKRSLRHYQAYLRELSAMYERESRK